MNKNMVLQELNVEANPGIARVVYGQVPDSILSEPFFAPLVSVVTSKEVPSYDHPDLSVPEGTFGSILSVTTDESGEVYYVVAFVDDSDPLSLLRSTLGFIGVLLGHYDPNSGIRLASCKQDEIVPVDPGAYYDWATMRAFSHLVSGKGLYYEELVN
ncbi:MAG: hypothetical protein QXZ09_10065 [Candidatus Methanomethylicaceae archaeon]